MSIAIETKINVSETAVTKINELINKNAEQKGLDRDNLALRVYVAGGGCSGVQFGMALTSEIRPDDETILVSDFKIILDPMSKVQLDGASVDFVDHELGARFKITPSEQSQASGGGGCACGAGGCG